MKHGAWGRVLSDQAARASLSILLNIAEGAGRFSNRDKKNFYVVSRASALECSALVDVLEDLALLPLDACASLRLRIDEISKMLFGMIRSISD